MTMMRLSCAVALLVLIPTCSAAQGREDAYLDARAVTLADGARQRRQTVDQSILEYQTLATERISAGYRMLGRDRLMFRRETASRVHWRRTGDIEIDVIGAREVVPIALPKVQVPGDLGDYMPHIAFDPMDSDLLIRLDTTSIIHPLGAPGERNYRFRSGDSTEIRLPDGRTIRLQELEFIPRRRDPHLIAGSFWIEADSHAIVQAVFRLARAFDFTRDGDADDDIPGFLQPFGVDLTHMAVDYGLYDLRWWLPHSVSAEGVLRVGSFGTFPLNYERTYSDYIVMGDTLAGRIPLDSAVMRGCTPTTAVRVSVRTGTGTDTAETVSARREERRARRAAAADSAARADSIAGKPRTCVPRNYVVTRAPDSALVSSDALPPSIYAGETLLTESERDAILDRVRDLPDVPWQVGRPRLALGLGGPGLVRYNRVEGLSLGARGQVDLGRVTTLGELRYGTADREITAELAFQREGTARTYRLGGYRRLSATDHMLRPFSLPATLNALLLGHDDARYFRATGAELILTPAVSEAQWYALRLYGERQTDVDRMTDFSVRHLLNDDHVFAPNIEASRADQYGGVLTLRRDFGLNPAAVRGGVELRGRAETGTFEFTQPALTLRASAPMPARLTLGIEGSAGTTFGDVPAQSIWYLGGYTTIRGYDYAVLAGDTYWRSRAELATSFPAFRLALFSDAGWAGGRDDFDVSRPLVSGGAGVSLLDGIVRIDVARALRSPTGWRVHLYTGGIL